MVTDDIRYVSLRLKPTVYDALRALAESHHHSLHAEILNAIDAWLATPPRDARR